MAAGKEKSSGHFQVTFIINVVKIKSTNLKVPNIRWPACPLGSMTRDGLSGSDGRPGALVLQTNACA